MNTSAARRLALALAVCAAGCSRDDGLNHGGEVSGRVSIDGKPVTAGVVELVSLDGMNGVTTNLRPDGTYTAKEPPVGRVKVAVRTKQFKTMPRQRPNPSGGGNLPGSPGMSIPADLGVAYVATPERYENVDTSGLTADLKPGKIVHDIDLVK